ncbi:MAG: DNA primase [Candidatus Aminicenantes bacterium]|nr:DNA primase [Candidatus Aminicenantes bacterium]
METIDQVRQVANIVEIASLYTTLRKRGKKYVGLCPFHSERDPSFTVDAEKQLFHCFGCGAGGDVFSLVMEKENLSFPEALRYLAERFHIPLPRQTRLSPELLKLEEKIFKVNEAALAFFRRSLLQTREGEAALDYLKKRGFSSQTLETLKVGYAPNAWNALLSSLKERHPDISLLEKAGLILPGQKKNDFHDRFRGRVIFPIFSLTGKVVGFGGRSIFNAEPKYLNSPETPVYSKGKLLYGLNWTKEAIREAGELILVEGYTDFASLFQAEIKNIAASLGTSLTEHQVALARRFALRIVINYDGDEAGRNAALRALPICLEKGVQTQILVLPQNLDPDGFLRQHGRDQYLHLSRKPVPGLKFLVDSVTRSGRMDVPEEKSRMVRTIAAVLEKIPDSIARSEYVRQVSELLSIEEPLLRQIIEKPAAAQDQEEKELFLPAEKRLLQILLEDRGISASVEAKMKREDLRGLKSEPALAYILEKSRKGENVVLAELLEAVGPHIARYLSRISLEHTGQPTEEEALDCLFSLRRTSLENEIRALQKEIVRCERNGESERLSMLLSQKQNLTRQILALQEGRPWP